MRRSILLLQLPVAALVVAWVACSSDDGGGGGGDAGVDATVDASEGGGGDGALDAPPGDGGADASDASDGGRTLPTVACGVVDGAAADDAVFYDVASGVPIDRRGDRMLRRSTAYGWALHDVTTGARVAQGDSPTAGIPALEWRGNVILVGRDDGATFETRSSATGALLHTFAVDRITQGVQLSSDGAYVLVVSDAELAIHAPTGASIRSIPASSLKTPGALPRSTGLLAPGPSAILYVDDATRTTVESVPIDGSATTLTTLPAPYYGLRSDRAGVVMYDPGTGTTSFTDASGATRGAGIPGHADAWGNYAWSAAAGTVKVWSISGPTAAMVGTYPLTGATETWDVIVSQSGYLFLSGGLLSLRGPTPALSAFAAPPSAGGKPLVLAVDPANGDWAIGDDDGRTLFGFGGAYDAYALLGCGSVVGVSGSTTGRLAVTFADRVEVIDAVTGGSVMPPLRVTSSGRALLAANGSVLVTSEPAAYSVPAGVRIGTWTGAPLDLSGDGTKVAARGVTGVDVRATTGGALLATRPVARGPATAIFSPNGSKLAVLRDVNEMPGAGSPVVFTTDVYSATSSVAWPMPLPNEGYAPTYWITDDLLSGQAIPSGATNPPRWDIKEGTLAWTGAGPATSTPGSVLYTVVQFWALGKFVRSGDGYLYDQHARTVTKVDGSMTPWTSAPAGSVVTSRAFAGPAFFWGEGISGAGVRRHRF